ncbi:hypothetical protein C815_01548 [Firmicutes bacterium M10-2]|nr:hypothetical protein C815_01548 [Firmicutes bacterium M10-2]
MRNFFILSKMLMKNSFSLGQHKIRTILLGLLMACSFIPLIVMFYSGSLSMFRSPFDLFGLETVFVFVAMLILWTSIFLFASTFYFSQDVPNLLVLPVSSWSIVGAKFFVNYVSCLTFACIGLLPVLVAYIQTHPHDVLGILFFVIQLFLNILPPLLVIGILTILVMRFMPFFANKDRFNLIVGILSIIFAVGISVIANAMPNAEDFDQLITMFFSKTPELPALVTFLFFHVKSAAQSIIFGSFGNLLINLAICFICIVIFYLCAKTLYLPTVLSMSSTSQKKKKKKEIKSSSPLKSYFINELKCLVRSPVYFSNCILSSFIMPIVLVAVLIVNPNIQSLTSMTQNVPFDQMFNLWILLFLAGAALSFFSGSMNGISGTAFSRQGRNLDFVKYIPLSMKKQIAAKAGIGIAFSMISSLIFLIPMHWLFRYPVYYDLAYLAGSMLSCILINQIAILIDGLHPKLNWEDETQAVKNNMNVMAEIFISWLILGLFIGLYFVIDNLMIYMIVAAILLVAFVALLGVLAPKLIINHLMKL